MMAQFVEAIAIIALIIVSIGSFVAMMSWLIDGGGIDKLKDWIGRKDHKDRQRLPREMRELSADEMATLYTYEQIDKLVDAYSGRHRYNVDPVPNVLLNALAIRKATDALDADKETVQ